jgi:hypothetical protein
MDRLIRARNYLSLQGADGAVHAHGLHRDGDPPRPDHARGVVRATQRHSRDGGKANLL